MTSSPQLRTLRRVATRHSRPRELPGRESAVGRLTVARVVPNARAASGTAGAAAVAPFQLKAEVPTPQVISTSARTRLPPARRRRIFSGSSHVARDCVYCENQVSYMVADASWKYVLYDHVSLRDTLRATHGVTRVTALQLSPSARMPVRGSCPPCRRTLATLNAALCGQGEGKEQLYDMANDPGETRNHLDQQDPAASKALQRMRVALERERAVRKRNCFFNVRSDQPACLVKLQCFCGNSNN